jgi:hypothetical protein
MDDHSIYQRDFLLDGPFNLFTQRMGWREFLEAKDEMGVNKYIPPRVPGLDGFDFFDLLEGPSISFECRRITESYTLEKRS